VLDVLKLILKVAKKLAFQNLKLDSVHSFTVPLFFIPNLKICQSFDVVVLTKVGDLISVKKFGSGHSLSYFVKSRERMGETGSVQS
jgi:hypothetical protein